MADEKQDLGRVTLVYVGAVHGTDGKLSHSYARIVDDPEGDGQIHIQPSMRWKKALMPSFAQPGTMYDFEIAKLDDNGDMTSVFTGKGARYLGTYQSKVIPIWQAAHQAQKDEFEAMREMKKEASKRYDLKSLEPWRMAYNQARGARKTMIVMRAIMFITKGS